MAMTGAGSTEEEAKHLAGDGDISLVSASGSDNVVDNSKSAKKHRDFLRETLQEVESEMVGAVDYINLGAKKKGNGADSADMAGSEGKSDGEDLWPASFGAEKPHHEAKGGF